MPDLALLQSPASAGLLVLAAVVGALMGAVGVGGVLLIPAVAWLAGLGIHSASATVLLSLAFTGVYGTVLHRRNGALDWRRTGPLCFAAVLFSAPGVWLAYRLDASVLTSIVAVAILFVGINVLLGRRLGVVARCGAPGIPEVGTLAGIGAVSGFGSGVSGAGGPLFSVPLMLLLRYPPLVAVGTGQALQVCAATAGTVAHLHQGTIDFGLAAALTIAELAGLHAGAKLARTADVAGLRVLAGFACLLVGCATLYSTL